MHCFHDFLRQRINDGGFSTEDVLASFLPLARQTMEAHALELVAPLCGIDELHVEGVRIWFENAKRKPPELNHDAMRRIDPPATGGIEIVERVARTSDVDEGSTRETSLNIAIRGEPILSPAYLAGFVSWEHELNHHDPLSDLFSLGMILASLATGLDFTQPTDLDRFVQHRRNPFQLNDTIHPVVAQAIIHLTELSRHRRPQDLRNVVQALENYREQAVDFDVDLARIDGFYSKDLKTKQQLVLAKLQERLFEISRRNRLLHFRPTMNTINLTQASVPLSFDPQHIRPDQILTWKDTFADQIVRGKPVSLNKHVNTNEAIYVPGLLDRIGTETRRDQAEFGFAQLRLVLCFLRWSNLKTEPIERFDSPFILLPVKLTKKKGIRDTYRIKPLTNEAEINPVVRFQFKQLFDIDLPERIDLLETDLNTFHQFVVSCVQASEPAVTLAKIDRPRIDIIHQKAQRRLDQYRRKARISGRGVRSFMDIDYSYDAANYHPLGMKLFHKYVAPPRTELQTIVEETPPPYKTMAAEQDAPTTEKERQFYSLRSDNDDNPYTWEFDLCNVTLGNFRYRKASLVRDYSAILNDPQPNPAFDATFSLAPRPVGDLHVAPPELPDRYDVVPCDPTQAAAISQARAGDSYIIQGPPGTGKSQTITNLVADYVAHGKRVLFVCEKRAAIDVVYLRLKQQGLQHLCCLIHDSQADKKEFVMDLRQTYDAFLSGSESAPTNTFNRDESLAAIERELGPLAEFNETMLSIPDHTGTSVRSLLSRAAQLSEHAPDLSPLEKEGLPDYVDFHRQREQIERLARAIDDVQPDGILAHHPLRLLTARLAQTERPLELVTSKLVSAEEALQQLRDHVGVSPVHESHWYTVGDARSLIDYAETIASLGRLNQLGLLDEESDASNAFQADERELHDRLDKLAQAREATKNWRQKLPREEAHVALQQARTLEGSWLRFVAPTWWRLRGVLHRYYDFRAHTIQPTWVQILEWLEREYEATDNVKWFEDNWRMKIGFGGEAKTFRDRVLAMRESIAGLSDSVIPVHRQLLAAKEQKPLVESILHAEPLLLRTDENLDAIFDDYEEQSFDDLLVSLRQVDDALDGFADYMLCLRELAKLPPELATVLRQSPLTMLQLEAAMANRSLDEIFRNHRGVARLTSESRDRHVNRLCKVYEDWQRGNSFEVYDRVARRFQENVRIASLPASQLKAEQKAFKKIYNRGRRELEHEFGKQTRHKSIRDLVAGDSGEVVKDLKPVWLMSPLSVSDALPMDANHFDVVIFDEASQITLEEAVPSLFRATQAIVVGDEMQLPPTDFFATKRSDEETLMVEHEDEFVSYDLSTNSFLNHAARNLPSRMLGWHYRSRSESLISFSNWAFYRGELLTVPEEELCSTALPKIEATSSDDGAIGASAILSRAVSFHFMEHGVYEKRRNRAEAEYIAEIVRSMLTNDTPMSIGVIAFSEAQQGEIEAALHRLGQEDDDFMQRLEVEYEREEDGQFVGLLVKNLENIQGDERDVIILSVCYAPDSTGKMRMNFGPINQAGGEKRLNVAFSRAKHHMALVSSIRFSQITNDYNDGASCLKNYLRYAAAASVGDADLMQHVLRDMSPYASGTEAARNDRDIVAEQIAAEIEELGFLVNRDVGQSSFRCDLAVFRQGDTKYRLGILVDNDEYYRQTDLVEREMMKPKLLKAFGWNITRVTAKDWYLARDDVMAVIGSQLNGEEPK